MTEKTNGNGNGNGKPKPDQTPDPTPEKDDPVRDAFMAGIAWQREIGDDTPRVAVNEVQKPFTLVTDEIEHPTAIALPDGFVLYQMQESVERFERLLPVPRRKGIFKAGDVNSFLTWMNAHCSDDSPVFARGAENLATNWQTPSLALVGIGNYSDHDKAAWHDFGAQYDFPVTKNWRDWTEGHKVWMSHSDFAEFVEGHLYEFNAPHENEELSEAVTRMIEALGGTSKVGSPGVMYALAEGVKLTVSESVEVRQNRSSGEMALQFTEEHKGDGGRPVAIPKFFYIRVPIFFGEEPTLVGALLRYRKAGVGAVIWQYELFAPDLVVKDAFDVACNIVDADRTLYLGSPDVQRP